MQPQAAPAQLQAWHRDAEVALGARDFHRAHKLCLRILSHAPLFADAYFLLAMIAAEHSNFGKALDVLERALKIEPGRSEYHAQKARCLLALTRPREAMISALHSLDLQPMDALTFDTIGVVLTRAGAQAEAVQPFRKAIELDALKPAYHYNLAAALQFSGDFSGAEAAYRAALSLDPRHHRAWSALAQLRVGALTAEDIAHIETLLAEERVDVDAELHLRHALAKCHEDAGRYETSFSQLERGKQRKRASLEYSVQSDLEIFQAARKLCTPEFCAATDGNPSSEPIFIVGMPRTGTTLVERILASHPDVFAAGELTNFGLTVKRATNTGTAHVLDVATLNTAATADFNAIGCDYIESTRPRTGHTRHFIDKMPLNFFYAGLIHRCLPNARIICLRRNGLDTCLSNYRQLFATSFSYYNYAYDLLDTGRYYQQFEQLMNHWQEVLSPSRFTEVHYEDVVTDIETQARRLFEFCGLDFRAEALTFHENAAPVSTASSVQVRQPIYKTSVERWRKYDEQLQPLIELMRNR